MARARLILWLCGIKVCGVVGWRLDALWVRLERRTRIEVPWWLYGCSLCHPGRLLPPDAGAPRYDALWERFGWRKS